MIRPPAAPLPRPAPAVKVGPRSRNEGEYWANRTRVSSCGE